MLQIVVVDRSAESRARIVDSITHILGTDSPDLEFVPRVSVKPLSPQELKFHAAPDICIVGEELVREELTEVGRIRKLLPATALIVRTDKTLSNIATVEQLARLGADDTMPYDISAGELLRKLILLSRRQGKSRSGKLILVDSGKGGLGVTTVAAALAEALLERGKSTVLADFDFQTQDLSRFLQVRPFVNENLQLLFDRNRPVTQEFVEQCLMSVWQDEERLRCMPPSPDCDQLYDVSSSYSRTLLSILEILDGSTDCVVVDVGAARGAFLRALYRVADGVVFLLNNDPASLYACVDRLSTLRASLAPGAEVVVVENASDRRGLSNSLLRQEFSVAAGLTPEMWSTTIPYCRSGARWPGSRRTLYSLGDSGVTSALNALVSRLGVVDVQDVSEKRVMQVCNLGLKLKAFLARYASPKKRIAEELKHSLAELPEPNVEKAARVLHMPLTVGEGAEEAASGRAGRIGTTKEGALNTPSRKGLPWNQDISTLVSKAVLVDSDQGRKDDHLNKLEEVA